jgi:hypothetical protein
LRRAYSFLSLSHVQIRRDIDLASSACLDYVLDFDRRDRSISIYPLSIVIGPISFVNKTADRRVRAIYWHGMTGPLFQDLRNPESFGYMSDFMLTSLAIIQCQNLRPIDLG